jgi:hypothetical protein
MNSSASVELRYEKCLLIWGNANRTVDGVTFSQEELVELLRNTATFIRQSKSIQKIAFVVNSVSVLCVSTFPGKTDTVNFLIERLQSDLRSS